MSAAAPAEDADLAEIRRSVRALCDAFPGAYWREADRERAYPTDFVAALTQAGFLAARSSVHVNFGPPHFDKLSACMTVVRQVLGGDANDLSPYVFVGDALNDASMFGGFPTSVGVANIKPWWDQLTFKPAYVTELPEGAGLREVITHIMKQPRARI
jgi:hydroxymethylpyrimidine pyrophosphatase-like HAD family hydrolase